MSYSETLFKHRFTQTAFSEGKHKELFFHNGDLALNLRKVDSRWVIEIEDDLGNKIVKARVLDAFLEDTLSEVIPAFIKLSAL